MVVLPPPKCLARQTVSRSSYLFEMHAWQTRVDVEPMVVTCNTGSVQHPVGEEQIKFICAIGSGGRSARSTQQSKQHTALCLCLLA